MATRSDDDHHDAVRGARRVLSAPVDVDLDLLAAVEDGLQDANGATSRWRAALTEHQGDPGTLMSRRPA